MYNSFIIVYKAHVTVHSVHKTDIVASEQSNKYEFQSLFEKVDRAYDAKYFKYNTETPYLSKSLQRSVPAEVLQ